MVERQSSCRSCIGYFSEPAAVSPPPRRRIPVRRRALHHQGGRLMSIKLIAGSVALALAIAVPAGAAVPRFKPKTIVTGASIGGVKVGMTKAKAVGVWGKPDRCQNESPAIWCQYTTPSTINGFTTPPQPYAGFWLKAGKVVVVDLETAENTAVDPKLARLKTSKNIKLGSTMAAARSAYDLPAPSGGEAGLSRALFRQGKHCTMFYAPTNPYTKIEAISVGNCNANVSLFVGIG